MSDEVLYQYGHSTSRKSKKLYKHGYPKKVTINQNTLYNSQMKPHRIRSMRKRSMKNMTPLEINQCNCPEESTTPTDLVDILEKQVDKELRINQSGDFPVKDDSDRGRLVESSSHVNNPYHDPSCICNEKPNPSGLILKNLKLIIDTATRNIRDLPLYTPTKKERSRKFKLLGKAIDED